METRTSFWRSLEIYTWKTVERSPLPRYWRHLGIGLVVMVIASSWLSTKNSVVGAKNEREVIERAAGVGDYEKARELLNHYTIKPMNQLEDLVYPERKVERRIAELEQKLVEYPGNRQIYLGLADLYGQLDNSEKADEYREKARVLDPNDPIFSEH